MNINFRAEKLSAEQLASVFASKTIKSSWVAELFAKENVGRPYLYRLYAKPGFFEVLRKNNCENLHTSISFVATNEEGVTVIWSPLLNAYYVFSINPFADHKLYRVHGGFMPEVKCLLSEESYKIGDLIVNQHRTAVVQYNRLYRIFLASSNKLEARFDMAEISVFSKDGKAVNKNEVEMHGAMWYKTHLVERRKI